MNGRVQGRSSTKRVRTRRRPGQDRRSDRRGATERVRTQLCPRERDRPGHRPTREGQKRPHSRAVDRERSSRKRSPSRNVYELYRLYARSVDLPFRAADLSACRNRDQSREHHDELTNV